MNLKKKHMALLRFRTIDLLEVVLVLGKDTIVCRGWVKHPIAETIMLIYWNNIVNIPLMTNHARC